MHDALEGGEGDGEKLGLRVKMRCGGERAPPPQGRVPAHTEEIPRCEEKIISELGRNDIMTWIIFLSL